MINKTIISQLTIYNFLHTYYLNLTKPSVKTTVEHTSIGHTGDYMHYFLVYILL